MFAVWHVLASIGLVLAWTFTNGGFKREYLALGVTGIGLDLDHLLIWSPEYLRRIFPSFWLGGSSGLSWTVRDILLEQNLRCVAHLWVWPLILSVGGIGALQQHHRRIAVVLFLFAAGCAAHLLMDGIFAIV